MTGDLWGPLNLPIIHLGPLNLPIQHLAPLNLPIRHLGPLNLLIQHLGPLMEQTWSEMGPRDGLVRTRARLWVQLRKCSQSVLDLFLERPPLVPVTVGVGGLMRMWVPRLPRHRIS